MMTVQGRAGLCLGGRDPHPGPRVQQEAVWLGGAQTGTRGDARL